MTTTHAFPSLLGGEGPHKDVGLQPGHGVDAKGGVLLPAGGDGDPDGGVGGGGQVGRLLQDGALEVEAGGGTVDGGRASAEREIYAL